MLPNSFLNSFLRELALEMPRSQVTILKKNL